MVENIMCAKLKRRRLSSQIPLTALSFVGVARALPGSSKEEKKKKNKGVDGKFLDWKLENTL